MKGFQWNEDNWKLCDSSDIMALVISRQGAGRGKIQPLFAYDMNAAANDPRGEVVKKHFRFFSLAIEKKNI